MGPKKRDITLATLAATLQSAELPYLYIPYSPRSASSPNTKPNIIDIDLSTLGLPAPRNTNINTNTKPHCACACTSSSTSNSSTPTTTTPTDTTSTKSTSISKLPTATTSSTISLPHPSLILPGPPTSFAYPDRVALLSTALRSALPHLQSHRSFEALENLNWSRWVTLQECLLTAQTVVREFVTDPVTKKVKPRSKLPRVMEGVESDMRHWCARRRFRRSERYILSKRLHEKSLEMGRDEMVARTEGIFEELMGKLQGLDEVESQIERLRGNRTWLEKMRDPHRKREGEFLRGLYDRELKRMRERYLGAKVRETLGRESMAGLAGNS